MLLGTNYNNIVFSGLQHDGNTINIEYFFDTLKVKPKKSVSEIKSRARDFQINLRYFADDTVSFHSYQLGFQK